ncbi:MAG: hypothetical protein PHD46_01535 [Eubacteriales bacterium]|nr:hypothetical protein [Eubacteriales bacterium]MDD4421698.1 hypothetical protein [Eubacteriales bacterium]HBR31914.1 hypothetical protein [Clostridiales bacterium]
MKKTKVIIGISLMVQSITFFILFLIYWGRKRSLAKTFAAFSAAGGLVGAFCLISELKVSKCCTSFDDEDIDEDFADLDVCEDDILCSFDESETEEKATE